MKPEVHLQVDPPHEVGNARESLLKAAESVFDVLQVPPREVSIVITTNERVQDLNRRFLGQDQATDVLAFPGSDDPSARADTYLGDVVISAPQAERQARELGHSLQEELTLLTVHGLLHLLGYRDEEPGPKTQMWAAQHRVLRSLDLERINPPE